MDINEENLKILNQSVKLLGLGHRCTMFIEHLDVPEGLLGAQCADAFLPILKTMLKDERRILSKECIKSILPILLVRLRMVLCNFSNVRV